MNLAIGTRLESSANRARLVPISLNFFLGLKNPPEDASDRVSLISIAL